MEKLTPDADLERVADGVSEGGRNANTHMLMWDDIKAKKKKILKHNFIIMPVPLIATSSCFFVQITVIPKPYTCLDENNSAKSNLSGI